MNTLMFLASEASSTAANGQTAPQTWWEYVQTYAGPVLMIGALILVFWLLIIRPKKKQEQEEQKKRNSVMVGDTITTIGGINGIVRQIKEEEDLYIIESSADKSKIAVKRWALQSKDASGPESLAAEKAAAAANPVPEKKGFFSRKNKAEK